MPANLHAFSIGTNAGVSVTLTPESNQRVYLSSVIGYVDKKESVEIKTTLSGTLATTTANAVVTGTSTKFLSELAVGDYVKVSSTSEYLKVLSIASDTSFTATATPSNIASGLTGSKMLCEIQTVADIHFDLDLDEDYQGLLGRPVVVVILTSTAKARLSVTARSL